MRYAILQGVGSQARTASPNNPEMWRKWPHLVVQGPSGQLAILPAPSGAGTIGGGTAVDNTKLGVAAEYYQYQNMMCHKALAYRHNGIIHWWKRGLDTAASDIGWRWHPYMNAEHLNDDGPQFDSNNNYNKYVIFDGANNTLHMFGEDSKEVGCGGLPVQDGVLWARTSVTDSAIYQHGNWTGQEPYEVQASPLHFFPGKRMFGDPGEDNEKFFFPDGNIAGISAGVQGGIDYRFAQTLNPADQMQGICDMVEHQGSIYYCSQQAVWANRIGMKGSFIYSAYYDNRQNEWGGASTYGLANVDTTRGSQEEFNDPQMRVFAKHRGLLFMLQADGKVFSVDPHAITKLADFTLDINNSPFGSGIVGGSLQETPLDAAGSFSSPRAFRPFLISFNDQLHAFLNYSMTDSIFQTRTGTAVAKGNAQGIAWFTSHDGVNWSDRTLSIGSTSGIITPSGNKVQQTAWNNTTSPFIHSAFQNVSYPSGYGARASFGESSALTGNTAPIDRGDDSISVLKPSGFRQATGEPKEVASRHAEDTDRLPIWTSGNMIDPEGTPFNQLQIKLDKGTISGFLLPTIVNYPSGYDYIDGSQLDGTTIPTNLLPEASGGVWGPFGQGAKGWDFTGVARRHVTGHINDADEQTNNHSLMLCFSDNPPTSIDTDVQVSSHFFELTKSSGWNQVNYVHWGGAFCGGYQRCDIHDPEIIIASGSVADPNPLIDIDRGWLQVKFKVIDFGFWDNVNAKFEYTLDDGLNWHGGTIASGSLGSLSTSTKEIDPSGNFGENHIIHWDYKSDIGANQYFPLVRIRMRGEV